MNEIRENILVVNGFIYYSDLQVLKQFVKLSRFRKKAVSIYETEKIITEQLITIL